MKKRLRRVAISMSILLGFGLAIGGGLFLAMKTRPDFYDAATIDESDERRLDSERCERNALSLLNMLSNGDSNWGSTFTANQVNSYFQEDYFKVGGDQNLPDGFTAPRVEMQDGVIRVGCRYGTGFLSTVVSLELKVWLIANEVNMVGLEVVRLRAGSLPISPRWMMEPVAEKARKENIDLNWYRRDGNPVAVFRLQANQIRPTFQIQRLELQKDQLVIVGQSHSGARLSAK